MAPEGANSASCVVGSQLETDFSKFGGPGAALTCLLRQADIAGGGLILQIPSLELYSALEIHT